MYTVCHTLVASLRLTVDQCWTNAPHSVANYVCFLEESDWITAATEDRECDSETCICDFQADDRHTEGAP